MEITYDADDHTPFRSKKDFLSNGVTGEVHYVDCGYNIISMPRPDVLKAQDAAGLTGE